MEEDKYKTLESLRETKEFLNGIKGYLKEDEESVELDTLAAIALLRRPELAKRGEVALGWENGTFVEVLYNYINFTFDSEAIVFRTMKIEALIRCVEARNKGMSSEEVYKKYIGIEESEDSIYNLYFGKRLNISQKQLVAVDYDTEFKETTFTSMAGDDFIKYIHQDEKSKVK